MKLYFLRHGVAEDRAASGTDFDRELTPEGRERMARAAKTMAALKLAPDVIVTSPLVRAKQTAAIVADGLKLRDRLVDDARLALDFDAGRLAAVLQDRPDADAVMLVGHEPAMSTTIGQLVGGARIDLKKGSLAYVEVPDRSSLQGELRWLIPPKVLVL